MSAMYGADVEALDRAAAELQHAADQIDASAASLARSLGGFRWLGSIAIRFHDNWAASHRPRMVATSAFLRDNADKLRNQANQQRAASSGNGDSGWNLNGSVVGALDPSAVSRAVRDISGWLDTGGFGVTASDLDRIARRFEELSPAERAAVIAALSDEQLAVFRDQISESRLKGGWTDDEKYRFFTTVLPSLDPHQAERLVGQGWMEERWRVPTDGMSADPSRAASDLLANLREGQYGNIGNDEIEIRIIDGKYVVLLPGVTDLSDGLNNAKFGVGDIAVGGLSPTALLAQKGHAVVSGWEGTNEADSVRDMHYARRSEMNVDNPSQTGANPYALAVKEALRRAGAGPDSEVMLVGHSFGAYTAVELASDPSFNSALGATGPYAVHVTHVLAAGAAAEFRMDGIPPETKAVVLNNSRDAVYLSERVIPNNNGMPTDAGDHHAVYFDGKPYQGAGTTLPNGFVDVNGDKSGHQPSVYAGYAANEPSGGAINEFMADALRSGYGGPGEVIHVAVKDPYR